MMELFIGGYVLIGLITLVVVARMVYSDEGEPGVAMGIGVTVAVLWPGFWLVAVIIGLPYGRNRYTLASLLFWGLNERK